MYRKIISIILLSALVYYVIGCTSMRYLSHEEISKINQEHCLWITLADSSQYEIKKPQVKGTQLTGYFGADGYREINISEVVSIGIRKVDVGKTLLIGTAGFAGAILLISALNSTNNSRST